MEKSNKNYKRRRFLQYAFAGTTTAVAIGWLFPKSSESQSQENLSNTVAVGGVVALDGRGEQIKLSSFLENVPLKKPVAVKGLSKPTYLVVESGPTIAPYGIIPVCTHQPNRVKWREDLGCFRCPNHGARYDYQGRVIRGPARRNLRRIKVVTQNDQIRLIQ